MSDTSADAVVSSLPESKCETCYFWEHPRRGKSCRLDRTVKIKSAGRTRTHHGTPRDYLCDEYNPLTEATCGECVRWKDEPRPFKKRPCSKLDLLDDRGKDRDEGSCFCKHFSKISHVEPVDNTYIRLEGVLADVLEITPRSVMTATILKVGSLGLAVEWMPDGPGAGEFRITPVNLEEDEDGDLVGLRQHEHTDGRTEVSFHGKVRVVTVEGRHMTLCGQSARTGHRTQSISIQMNPPVRPHVVDAPPPQDAEDSSEKPPMTKAAKRVQDEPWGDDWSELKEQMQTLIDAGNPPPAATIAVSRAYHRQLPKLSLEEIRRLQRQLLAAFTLRK